MEENQNIIPDNSEIVDSYQDENGDTVIEISENKEITDPEETSENNEEQIVDNVDPDLEDTQTIQENTDQVETIEQTTNISDVIIDDAATGATIESNNINDDDVLNALKELISDKEITSENEEQNSLEDTEENTENITEDSPSDNTINTIDYTSILSSIDADLEDLNLSSSNLETIIYENSDNNTLQTLLNDINLTNTLLIIIFISILVNAVINISRRIF